MRYSVWDEVVLRVEEQFGYGDQIFKQLKVMIIGVDHSTANDHTQYLCYVPPYESVPFGFPTFKIDHKHARHFLLEAKFIGDIGCFITANNPIFKHIPAPNGELCDRCRTWVDDARRENNAFMCRACRENPYR